MSEPEFKERRQGKRIQKHFILKYYDASAPDQKFSATQMKNISRGGMCLITEKEFAGGTVLFIEIKSAFFSNITLLQAEVLSSKERLKNIIYETRVKFLNLSPEASAVIQKSIEFFQNKEKRYD